MYNCKFLLLEGNWCGTYDVKLKRYYIGIEGTLFNWCWKANSPTKRSSNTENKTFHQIVFGEGIHFKEISTTVLSV